MKANILAIEPDKERGDHLRRFIGEHVDAEITLASSSDLAIAALASRTPDVVLTSALLSPAEESRLLSHLKSRDATRDLVVLTVPPVLASEPPPQSGWTLPFLKSRATPWRAYDPDAVGGRIADALQRARALKRRLPLQPDGPAVATRARASTSALSEVAALSTADRPGGLVLAAPPDHIQRGRHHRAYRWTPEDVRWLRGVQAPWGLSLRLVNISSSGLLLESGSKLIPESATELRLLGMGMSLVVPVRVVRSEIAQVTGTGVRYHTAAAFQQKFELLPESSAAPPRATASLRALTELLARATSDAEAGSRSRTSATTFEEGLREVFPGCDVRLRRTVTMPPSGSDSIYFTIPTHQAGTAVLQVVFPPNHEPAPEELKLLKTAATLASAVLQHDASF
jgi:hypothetical protein